MEMMETQRLFLRRSTPEDYKKVFEEYTPAAAMDYFGAASEADLQVEKTKYEGGMVTYRTSFVHFHLIEKTSGEIIGDCCFHTWYVPHTRAEIGYGLKKEAYKNRGYMSEALDAVLTYGFSAMGLNRVEAFVNPSNMPSRKLLQGAGFTQEGLLAEHYVKDGVILDSLVFGLLKRNFVLRKGKLPDGSLSKQKSGNSI